MLLLQVNQTIYDMSSGGEFINIAFNIASSVKKVMLPMASAIIGILIILELYKVLFAEGQISWLKMFKLIIFFFAFQQYEPLVKSVNDLFQGIVNDLSGYTTSTDITFPNGNTVSMNRSVKAEIDGEFILVTVAKKFMSMMQLIAEVLLIAMGPLAITFSFIPGQEGVFTGWMRNLLHVILWSVTFMILDMITSSLTLLQEKEFISQAIKNKVSMDDLTGIGILTEPGLLMDLMGNFAETGLMKLVISAGYFFTPWLTSKYFGTSHSGGFTRQMMATAGGVWAGAKLAASTATGGIGAVAGGSSAASGTAKAASSASTQGSGGGSGVRVSGFMAKSAKNGFEKVNSSEN